MRFLPIGLDLTDRPCVVVGGGPVGTRKALTLLRAGARVTVVAPTVTETLAAAIEDGAIQWIDESFREEHLAGARLAVLATDDALVNGAAARLATSRRILSCDASSGAGSELIFGALLERDGLTIAAFTDGRDPAGARDARDRIAAWLEDEGAADGGGEAAPGEAAPGEDGPGGGADSDAGVLILVAHGSRDPGWGAPLRGLVDTLAAELGPDRVRLAYAQFASPTLAEAVDDAARAGITRVRVLPLFMTAAGHVERDIRPAVDAVRRAHDDIEVELLPPVGQLPSFRQILVDVAREVTS